MQKLFTKILVPVKFNRNTAMVMNKAVEVANLFDCDLHLLHVVPPAGSVSFLFDGHFSGPFTAAVPVQGEEKMEKLVNVFEGRLKNGLFISSSVQTGNWQTLMKEEIITRQIDLVLVPKYHRKFTGSLVQEININRLSSQAQCPVLTATRKLDLAHLKNIVVPVNDFIPVKKLTIATFLARKFNGIIHLMGNNGHTQAADKQNIRCITRSYQMIRDYSNVRVHCLPQHKSGGAAGTLDYAKNVNADLIVVNTGRESRLKGWLSRWFGKYLYMESNIPVLTIAPQQ